MSTRVNTNIRKPRSKETGALVGVRLQPDQLAAIDGWRLLQPDVPGRPEAIRRLLAERLKERGRVVGS